MKNIEIVMQIGRGYVQCRYRDRTKEVCVSAVVLGGRVSANLQGCDRRE